jgi:GNAT superfamily N-acetyltransferase
MANVPAMTPQDTNEDQSSIIIRHAEPEDAEALAGLVRELATHEGKHRLEHVTPKTIASWAFGPEPAFNALLALVNERPAGYLAFYPAFSFFKGGRVLLVENLYVAETARGLGLGRRLMAAAAREAVERGYLRMELNVRAESPMAKAFYTKCGLAPPGEMVYRIEDEALRRLADSDITLTRKGPSQ